MPLVTATCNLCDKEVQVDVPPGFRAYLDHYNNDKVVIVPSVQKII